MPVLSVTGKKPVKELFGSLFHLLRHAQLYVAPCIAAASETNLFDDAQRPVQRTPRGFPVAVQPWKIVTLKLTR